MIIALIGPHAIGKTTAVKNWLDHYGRYGLRVVNCDNNRLTYLNDNEIVEEREPRWSGSTEEKQAVAKECADSPEIFVVEGNTARAIPWMKTTSLVCILHVYTSPEGFQSMMRERCEKTNKTYRDDYWDYTKLSYESSRRFNNFHGKHPHHRVIAQAIYNREDDWKTVTEIFGREFRQLYNQNKRR